MYIRVKVQAKAKNEKIEQTSEDHFEISVKEPPERNLANIRVVEILADHFFIPSRKVRIINGHHSPAKLISIDND